jgi:hypothetical protein
MFFNRFGVFLPRKIWHPAPDQTRTSKRFFIGFFSTSFRRIILVRTDLTVL